MGSFLFAAVAAAPFITDAFSFAIAAMFILTITGTFKASAAPTGSAPHHNMFDGLRWVWSHRLFRSLTAFGAVWNFMSGAVAGILVLFALETLRTGEVGFGLLMAGLAIGGITGGLVAPWLRARMGPGTLMLSASALQGLAYGTAGLLSSPLWAGVTLAIGQVGFFAVLVVFFSLRQAIVPDHLLGRVTAAMRLIGAGALPFGAASGGIIGWLPRSTGAILGGCFGVPARSHTRCLDDQQRQHRRGARRDRLRVGGGGIAPMHPAG